MPSIIEPSSAATRIVCGDAIKHFFIVGPANVLAREDGSRAKAVRRGRSSYEWNLWLSGRENWVPASAQSSENRRWRRNEEEKSIIVHNKYHFPFVVLLQGFHPHAHGKPNNIFNEYWCLSSEERFGVEIWKIVIWLVCGKEWREKKCCFRTPFGLERLSSSSSSHTKVFSHFSLLRVLPSKRPAWESANNFVNKHQPRTVCLHSLIPKHCAYIWGIIVCQGGSAVSDVTRTVMHGSLQGGNEMLLKGCGSAWIRNLWKLFTQLLHRQTSHYSRVEIVWKRSCLESPRHHHRNALFLC